MSHFVLVDGNNVGYAAQMGEPRSNAVGEPAQAIYGSLRKLAFLCRDHPTALPLVVWDGHPEWRYIRYPEYKATRHRTPEEQLHKQQWDAQRPRLQALLHAAGVPQVVAEQAEADDVANQLAPRLVNGTGAVLLFSSDQDWFQTVAPRIVWRRATHGDRRVSWENFAEETGFASPQRHLEGKLLMGDANDNVPGLPEFGKRTAQRLLAEFGTLEAALAAAFSGVEPQDPYLAKAWPSLKDPDIERKLELARDLMDLSRFPRLKRQDYEVLKPAEPSVADAQLLAELPEWQRDALGMVRQPARRNHALHEFELVLANP